MHESEVATAQPSFAGWIFNSLGWGAAILPLVGLLCFAMALVVIIKGKGPFVGPALLLIVSLPLLVGIFGALQGAMRSYTVIAMSDTQVKASEVASGISSALVSPVVAMLLMTPSLVVALFGSFVRSLQPDSNQPTNVK